MELVAEGVQEDARRREPSVAEVGEGLRDEDDVLQCLVELRNYVNVVQDTALDEPAREAVVTPDVYWAGL